MKKIENQDSNVFLIFKTLLVGIAPKTDALKINIEYEYLRDFKYIIFLTIRLNVIGPNWTLHIWIDAI